jgi:lactobin A/cerein 7B family class IIb bacteriocin
MLATNQDSADINSNKTQLFKTDNFAVGTELNVTEMEAVSGGFIPLIIGGLVVFDAFIWGAVWGKSLNN